MRVIDITHALNEKTAIYEGDPRFSREIWRTVEEDGYCISKLRMGSHTGTHVDAPGHFIEGGRSIAELPVHRFVGECLVAGSVDEPLDGCPRLLLKGDAGRITLEQAQELIEKGVRLIGTEKLSIGGDEVHRLLLGAECVVLEYLKLDKVAPGRYLLSAAPLKIDADGSPIRACLIEGELKG